MSLFDNIVDQALRNSQAMAALRPVVEKEILHHDIMRELNQAGLLQQLTFIGGTCLRACYGSNRLSEDLDFTGGRDFNASQLHSLKTTLEQCLGQKYDLPITVTEPKPVRRGNVDTWTLRVDTRPERRDMPAQRINLDICSIPSYQVMPRTLLNPYEIDLGTGNLVINAQSREEIFTDKLIAFAMRRGRIKNRDLWDMAWLAQRQVEPAYELLANKIADHGVADSDFRKHSQLRLAQLKDDPESRAAFEHEMLRFLAPATVEKTIRQDGFWAYLIQTITAHVEQGLARLAQTGDTETGPEFPM